MAHAFSRWLEETRDFYGGTVIHVSWLGLAPELITKVATGRAFGPSGCFPLGLLAALLVGYRALRLCALLVPGQKAQMKGNATHVYFGNEFQRPCWRQDWFLLG